MRAPLNHPLVLGLVGSLGTALLVGCENEVGRANKDVQDIIAQAAREPEGGTSSTIGLLEKAAAQNEASPGLRAAAKSALAAAELDRANAVLGKYASLQQQALQRIYEMRQIAAQIAAAQTMIDGYRALEPTDGLADVRTKIAEARGRGESDAWKIGEQETKIPTLAALTQQMSKLTAELTRREDAIESMSAERQKHLDDADKAFAEAEDLKGQQSVDRFNQGVELRKKANELQVQLEKAELDLIPIRQELKLAEAQASILRGLVGEGKDGGGSLAERQKELAARWEKISEQIDKQNARIRDLSRTLNELSGAEGADTLPVAEGEEPKFTLAKLLADLQAVSDDASTQLNNVITHYTQAADAADELFKQLTAARQQIVEKQSLPAKGIDATQKAFDSKAYVLQAAMARQSQGIMAMDRARVLTAQRDLTNLLEALAKRTEITVPQTLAGANIGEAIDKAVDEAQNAFTAAATEFQNVAEAPMAAAEHKNAARLATMFLNYHWSQLMQVMGERQDANSKLSDAIRAGKDFVDNGGTIVAVLPPELAEALPVVQPPSPEEAPAPEETPAPGAQPATEPGELMPERPADAPAPEMPVEPAAEPAPADEAGPEAPAEEAMPDAQADDAMPADTPDDADVPAGEDLNK